MKKHLLILLLACVASISASAYDFCVDGIYYDKNGSEATVTSGNTKYSGSVTIPESVTYSGTIYSVTSIGGWAFFDCSGLTSATIPNSVTSIGLYAFAGCSGLTSMTIPDSVTSIGVGAFSSCAGLEAFYGKFASSDYRCLIVDDTLNSFAPSGITSYNIPNSVTSIGEFAFEYCCDLTSVTIPNSVTSIGIGAFSSCAGLEAFYGNFASSDNRCLIIDGTLKSFAPYGLTTYSISDSVTSISGFAFYGCSGLTSVTIPDSVTSIGNYAFAYCSGLTSMIIPDSVTSIGNFTFFDCRDLTAVTIPDSVTSIGDLAFFATALYNNDSNWENNVLYICNHLIKANTDLSSAYTIKDGTVTIADNAFSDCSGLTTVTIPNSVTSIGDGAFADCSGLMEMTLDNNNPANILLGYGVFYDVPTSTCILYVPMGSKELYAVADQWKDFENIEEFVSGVKDVIVDNEFDSEAPYYDLMGRRVVNPTNGIYIKNGKKILVR